MQDNVENSEEVIKPRQFSWRKFVVEVCFYILLIFVCVFIVPKYVIQRTVVDGPSMLNTLHDGESLIVEKVSYHFTDPDRYDIIVFYPYGRDDPEDYYVKRVIGLPGETIQVIGSDVYINGDKLGETYGKDPIQDPGVASEPIKLADDEFFVMGDNRTVSEDSRFFGPVKKSNISGRALLRIYPFDSFGLLTDK